MSELLMDSVETLLETAGADPHPVLDEMQSYGVRRGFPTVGPDVGRFLSVLVRIVDATRVFEFGSGFGYSAAWFSRGLGPDSELHLTDYDEDDLSRAVTYLDRAGFTGTVHATPGDAIETFEETEGSFDVVLLDIEKDRYPTAFSRLQHRIRPGGVLVADNMMGGPVTPDSVLSALDSPSTVDGASTGIARYIETIRESKDYRTSFLPLGEGIAVSTRTAGPSS
ncbi:MAG: O-methyltransferase [Halodesulfurarchaeum sp.]